MDILTFIVTVIIALYLIAINHKIYHLNGKVHRIMNAEEKLVEFVSEINDETNRIAGLIEDLLTTSKEGDVDAEELETALRPVVDALKAVGAIPPEGE